MTDKQEPGAVTQADRDAAVEAARETDFTEECIERIKQGLYDSFPFVQAFARHRLAHSQAVGLDPLADPDCPLQSRRDFVEHWRGVVADHSGHTMVANANTVRRLVHIIDALATHPAQKAQGDE
jgi:hypothetical protein